MKSSKILALMLVLVMVFSLAACGSDTPTTSDASSLVSDAVSDVESLVESTESEVSEAVENVESTPEAEENAAGYELALITDLGTIDDKSFNQGSWEGLEQYALESGKSHKYYQPTEQSDDAYLSSIGIAVENGAKVIVTPGYLFEVPIFKAQDMYPEVTFILVDGAPNNGAYDDTREDRINDNVVGLLYAEEEAGFLAGYGAVKDGNTNLGFMGGMAVPAVVRFGYGFVQGANYAAKEMSLEKGAINMYYHYTGAFEASPEAKSMASSWYNNGTEVIFACGGAVGNSVMAAAEEAGTKVVGVDVDQSAQSETVMTSAMKGLKESVYDSVKAYYDGNFPGGEVKVYGAAVNGVELPMATSRFTTFSQADYDAIYEKLVAGGIEMTKDADASGNPVKVTQITAPFVTLTEV